MANVAPGTNQPPWLALLKHRRLWETTDGSELVTENRVTDDGDRRVTSDGSRRVTTGAF